MQRLPSEKRYQLVMDQAVEHAVIIMDNAGSILEWSTGAEKLFGWTALEACGQPIAVIFTDEDKDTLAASAELNTAKMLGKSSDVRWHLRKDGTTVFCDGIVTRILGEDGSPLGFGKVVREAYSTRKNQPDTPSNATSEQRSFLAAVLESVENGIITCDKGGRLTFFNEAAQAMHGLEALPLAANDWVEHYRLFRADGTSPLPLAEVPLQRALQGERVEDAAIVIHAADGRRRNVLVSGRPLQDGSGQILGAVISMNDVTALHDTRRALNQVTLEQGKREAAEASAQRLRKAEEQLRVATEAAQLGIWTWDEQRAEGTWENPQMYRIFGVSTAQAVFDGMRRICALCHPDDAPALRQALDATLRHGSSFHFAGRVLLPGSDATRWIELHGAREALDSSVIIGTAADVTARRQAEKTLEEAQLRVAVTLSAGEVATWIWDVRNDRMIGDPNLAKLFNVPDDGSGVTPLTNYLQAIHPDDAADVSRRIQHALDARDAYRATYRIRDGEGGYRWVSARGRIENDSAGQPEFLAGVILDITGQKEAEGALRVAEERYRTLIASMDQAFAIVRVLVDAHGRPVDYRFEEVNRAFAEQSGLVDAAGKTIREMVPDIESRWIAAYGRVAQERQPARFSEHSGAMGYWWDVYATPMGEPEELRIAILFTDITARKDAEENLRQLAADLSETNRRKTEFLATLAHELRNPLAPMRTGLDLLRLTGKTAEGGNRMLEMMDRQLKQMVHLIDDLMDVSRINSGKIELKRSLLDVKDAVAGAVEAALPAIDAARHTLQVELPAQPLMVDADPTRLAQIFGNLLTNAVKYTPHGGRIGVTARQAGESVVIVIDDTGLGIPPEEQGRVFDMFSQVSRNMGRAEGGLGIGLSLVRSLVEMHGGSVSVASRGAGQGSSFSVTLPLHAAAAPDDAAGAVGTGGGTRPGTRGLRVLIADDNVDAAIILGSLLEITGNTVDIVHDGVQALQRIAATQPDLAIIDIGMPGLNGYEVAKRIRGMAGMERVMLAALTGWGGELDRRRSEDAGFDAHLTKPAGLDELNALVERVVERAGGGQR